MNYLRLIGLGLSLLLCSLHTLAQEKIPVNEPDYNKPRLFNNLPASISIDSKSLASLLTDDVVVGSEVTLQVNNLQTPFTGKVVSATSKYENKVKSVIIRLNKFNGATLTLSSSTNPDGTASFVGRIVSFQHGDAYELQRKGEQYILTKKTFNEMVTE